LLNRFRRRADIARGQYPQRQTPGVGLIARGIVNVLEAEFN
jgi:hypothetical protein